jgi:hypothetical protein
VSVLDGRCTACLAYKQVTLNADGLCVKCASLSQCSVCRLRYHPQALDKDGVCRSCLQKRRNPNYTTSVRNVFGEEALALDPDAVDIEVTMRGQEHNIASALEARLQEIGYL